MHLKVSEIIWIKTMKERWGKFRRKLFLTEHDLIEFIRQFEDFKEKTRTSVRMVQIENVTKSEFEQKTDKLRYAIRMLKTSDTKNKNMINKVKKSVDYHEDCIEEWEKERDDIARKFIQIENLQKEINHVNALNHQKLQAVNKKLELLNSAYHRANNLETSMDKLQEKQELFAKKSIVIINSAKDQLNEIQKCAHRYEQAIDSQAKGHVGTMQGILREIERKYNGFIAGNFRSGI